MTVSLSLAVKEYLLLHKKIEDINVYHISQLPELPKKGAFLLQDIDGIFSQTETEGRLDAAGLGYFLEETA